LYGDGDLGVRAVLDLVVTGRLDGLAHQELAAVHVDVVRALESLRDVPVAHRTVDAALTGAHLDGELGVLEDLGEAFSVCLALGELLGPLREARPQLGLVGLRGREGETLRDEPVPGVTVLDGDLHAGFTQLVDRFQQDDVHFRTSFSVIGMMARVRARLIVNASLRWYLAFTPVRRRGRILPVSLMKRRSILPSW